ncbi:cation:proton antiporter [Methylovirgula sp. HY1]|uniref:cation:proton antiporter domain-containing protein n=1 Tax=Methylovirgula sp. HY1 TaxID=2822761 RepID=UPI001C5A8855|nr:cation:proton antiporter [Methylovirgula sp. HY1]QXX73221.1 Glutathione-regulated potassium-efflux system protein KefC [Methylovirgula sp. HY1]
MGAFAPAEYKEILLFLGTAGIVAPLFRRLRLSPIYGFLIAGFLLGPHGLGFAADKLAATGGAGSGWISALLSALALGNMAQIEPIAEFGVVFLLFMIGLELSWQRLARMRRLVFGFGFLQVFGCAAVLAGLALLFGVAPIPAIILGFALALSSTAIVIPDLADRKRLGTNAGRTTFAVLLFQDLMVAPLLFMIMMLQPQGGNVATMLLYLVLPAFAGLSLVVLLGRLVMRPFFHLVAAAGSAEFFMAACLLVVVGAGVLSAISGLSMGLGAFVAGLLLAETEYRREIEVTIEPFKGLLLGLFFVSVGASLDLSLVGSAPIPTLGIACGIILVKFVVTYAAGRGLRLPHRIAAETALMLGPGGEFAFVMITTAVASTALPRDLGSDALVSVTLSMFAIPVLGALAGKLPRPMAAADAELAQPPAIAEDGGPYKVIIVGFGRVGQLVGEMLSLHKIPFLAIDTNAGNVKAWRGEGVDIYWGNAARPEFLLRCGLAKTRALIVTVDAQAASEEIVTVARGLREDLTIVARARDAEHATKLYGIGVTDAVPETIEASLQLSEAVLVDLGIPMGHVIASIHDKRETFRKALQPKGGAADKRHQLKKLG